MMDFVRDVEEKTNYHFNILNLGGGFGIKYLESDKEIDLKKAAKVSGNKSVEMIHVKDLLGLTGYIRGGCSPVGMKKKFPTYIEESCMNFEKINNVLKGERERCMDLLKGALGEEK